ncbi:MAG: hypothetical protein WCP21_17995, partial [Armatimonadota bacterium]
EQPVAANGLKRETSTGSVERTPVENILEDSLVISAAAAGQGCQSHEEHTYQQNLNFPTHSAQAPFAAARRRAAVDYDLQFRQSCLSEVSPTHYT